MVCCAFYTVGKLYLYNPGITSVMLVAGGCLTMKRSQRCLAVATLCLVVFVDLFHFLLLFLLFINFGSYFLLSKGVRFVTFCTFFLLLITMINYFLLGQEGQDLYFIHCGTRGKGCDALLGPGVNPLEGSPNVKLRKLGPKGTLPASNSRKGVEGRVGSQGIRLRRGTSLVIVNLHPKTNHGRLV
jgi:hypothetical protein